MGPRCDDAAKAWHAGWGDTGRGDAGAMQVEVTQTGARVGDAGARWQCRPGCALAMQTGACVDDAELGTLATQAGAMYATQAGAT
jgi:hypothetical protein